MLTARTTFYDAGYLLGMLKCAAVLPPAQRAIYHKFLQHMLKRVGKRPRQLVDAARVPGLAKMVLGGAAKQTPKIQRPSADMLSRLAKKLGQPSDPVEARKWLMTTHVFPEGIFPRSTGK